MKEGTEENECSFVCGMVIELSGGRGRESSPLQPPDQSYNMRRPYDEYAETEVLQVMAAKFPSWLIIVRC